MNKAERKHIQQMRENSDFICASKFFEKEFAPDYLKVLSAMEIYLKSNQEEKP